MKAYRLEVLVVESPRGSVQALACERETKCGIGRGSTPESAVAASVRALERGDTVTPGQARAIVDRAEDVWGAEFHRQALGGVKRTRRAKKR